jgi:hypothetical protein
METQVCFRWSNELETVCHLFSVDQFLEGEAYCGALAAETLKKPMNEAPRAGSECALCRRYARDDVPDSYLISEP